MFFWRQRPIRHLKLTSSGATIDGNARLQNFLLRLEEDAETRFHFRTPTVLWVSNVLIVTRDHVRARSLALKRLGCELRNWLHAPDAGLKRLRVLR
jgi:hypothetical protein